MDTPDPCLQLLAHSIHSHICRERSALHPQKEKLCYIEKMRQTAVMRPQRGKCIDQVIVQTGLALIIQLTPYFLTFPSPNPNPSLFLALVSSLSKTSQNPKCCSHHASHNMHAVLGSNPLICEVVHGALCLTAGALFHGCIVLRVPWDSPWRGQAEILSL